MGVLKPFLCKHLPTVAGKINYESSESEKTPGRCYVPTKQWTQMQTQTGMQKGNVQTRQTKKLITKYKGWMRSILTQQWLRSGSVEVAGWAYEGRLTAGLGAAGGLRQSGKKRSLHWTLASLIDVISIPLLGTRKMFLLTYWYWAYDTTFSHWYITLNWILLEFFNEKPGLFSTGDL